MALTVNSNIPSLNAQRNLVRSGKSLSEALERLSSGLRINRAGDDAAGLAISETLRTQIRGLNMAVRNANDGLSVVYTAEGALAEATNLIQRIRELSIQSANGTNSDANRASLQAEVDQLIAELDRTGTTTQFNGRTLLDGTFDNVAFHVGPNKDQIISVSISDVRAQRLGAVAIHDNNAVGGAIVAGDLDDLTINGVALDNPTTADDGISSTGNALSAIALASVTNRASGQTGVTAEVGAAEKTGASAVGGGLLDTTNSLTINGVDILGTVVANDANGALTDLINAVSNQTGVTASLTAGTLTLTAADGRNIEVVTAGTGHTITGLDAGAGTTLTKGTVVLYSTSAFTIGGTDAANAGWTAGTYNVDFTTAINSADVSSAEAAEETIRKADFALRDITQIRAALGALTNRLESTISNLQTSAENLTASESRIRDADFAVETAALTRAQILQQAGTAVLAQANLVPQAVLSLLQG